MSFAPSCRSFSRPRVFVGLHEVVGAQIHPAVLKSGYRSLLRHLSFPYGDNLQNPLFQPFEAVALWSSVPLLPPGAVLQHLTKWRSSAMEVGRAPTDRMQDKRSLQDAPEVDLGQMEEGRASHRQRLLRLAGWSR